MLLKNERNALPISIRKWNNDKIQNNHNCYAYVLNAISGKRKDKPQPGYYINFPSLDDIHYKCDKFFSKSSYKQS